MSTIIEYPSWNPYNSPTIGNLRCYVLGSFISKLLSLEKETKRIYFVNDFADPLINSGKLANKRSVVHSSILDILKNQNLKFIHESEVTERFKDIVLKDLETEGVLNVIGNLKRILKSEKIFLRYGNQEVLVTTEGKPLYLLTDLCFSYQNNKAQRVFTFLGEDQKKHCLNLIEINKLLKINNRIFHLYGLVYKDNFNKYSKRKGDSINFKWFSDNKRELFLFFNNQKSKSPIFNFNLSFQKWCFKNRIALKNINLLRDSSHQVLSCGQKHKAEELIKKAVLLSNTNLYTSPLVDHLFYSVKRYSKLCCNENQKLLLKLLEILT